MSATAAILLGAAALYAAAGIVVAVAFVSVGVMRVPPVPSSVSFGARLLLLPGAAALWPVVLGRWLGSKRP